MSDEPLFYICDLRKSFRKRPYVTFWRPENAGYAFPLSWAGKYTAGQILDGGRYYTQREDDELRFPVPCSVVDKIAVAPKPGTIDGDAGPVVPMSATYRNFLRANAALTKEPTS